MTDEQRPGRVAAMRYLVIMIRRFALAACIAFCCSRFLFFSLATIGAQIQFVQKTYENSVWETRIVFDTARVLPELERLLMIGDAWWYRSIALHGYDMTTPPSAGRNWAFFPLFPLLIRAVHGTRNFAVSGSIIANIAFFSSLILIGMCAVQAGFTADDGVRAIFYAAFFPTSYFASLPLTEALFLALSAGSMVAGLSSRWPAAGVLGMLAALTRLPGVLLVGPLAIMFFQRRSGRAAQVLWLLLIPAGTGLFMTYLYRHTGDPLAFLHAQAAWHRQLGWSGEPLLRYLMSPQSMGEAWNLVLFNALIALLLLAAGVALLATRQIAFGVYTLASVLLALTGGSLQSVGRYGLVVFPVFLWLGAIGRRPMLDKIMLATFTILLGWFIALFTLRVDFALA